MAKNCQKSKTYTQLSFNIKWFLGHPTWRICIVRKDKRGLWGFKKPPKTSLQPEINVEHWYVSFGGSIICLLLSRNMFFWRSMKEKYEDSVPLPLWSGNWMLHISAYYRTETKLNSVQFRAWDRLHSLQARFAHYASVSKLKLEVIMWHVIKFLGRVEYIYQWTSKSIPRFFSLGLQAWTGQKIKQLKTFSSTKRRTEIIIKKFQI